MKQPKSNMRKIKISDADFWFIDDEKYNKFYRKLAAGTWEPETFAFLNEFLDKKTYYFDVGSWIGVTPAYAAKRAKHVVSVEPEPFCISAIERTIAANELGNVTLLAGALSAEKSAELFMVGGGGSSVTSLVPAKGVSAVNVKGVQPEQLIQISGNHDFVLKVDIEGFEYLSGPLIQEFKSDKLRAVQLALHPVVVAQKTFWPFGRFKAAFATRKLVLSLSESFGSFKMRNYNSLTQYLLLGIILSRKCCGTEVIFSKAEAGTL